MPFMNSAIVAPRGGFPAAFNGIRAAIASALSLLLGGLVMLLCAALDDRIYAERDLAGVAGMLVQVPRVRRWRRSSSRANTESHSRAIPR